MQITKNNLGIVAGLILSLLTITNSFAQKNGRNVIKQERKVSSFSEIIIKGVYNIYLEQGSKESVIVEANEDLQEIITVENEGDALVLGWEKRKNVMKRKKMNIYITLKDINKLEVRGVGSLKTTTPITFKKLNLNIDGVGNTVLELKGDVLNGNINALGSLTLKGNVSEVDLNNSGIGSLSAFDLITKKLELNNSGIGKVEVHADETIDITSSGIGSVRYKGNAQDENINSSGLGKVVREN